MASNKNIEDLLKEFGYTMPMTDDEVLSFEEKYKSKYTKPEKWSSVNDIINKKKSKVINLKDKVINPSQGNLSMAARDGKIITDKIREQMNKDKRDAKK